MDDQEFKAPETQVGTQILFSPDPGGKRWYTAQITTPGERSVEVFCPEMHGNMYRDNVRHKDDPVWKEEKKRISFIEDGDSGVFVIHPNELRLRAVEARLAELCSVFAGEIAAKLAGDAQAAAPVFDKKAGLAIAKAKAAKIRERRTDDPLQPAVVDEIDANTVIEAEVEA